VSDINEDFVTKTFEYQWQGESVNEEAKILRRMEMDSHHVKREVAKQIANMLNEQGKLVFWDGELLIGGVKQVNKSSCIEVDVDVGGYADGYFTLKTYDAAAPVPLALDH
jgi:hypothetical protein